MPDETVPLFRKGKQLCVDLRTCADIAPDVSEGWRAELAKALDADRLVFATSTGYILREQGKESSLEKGAIRLEDGWKSRDSLFTPHALRGRIAKENANTLTLLIAQLRSPMGIVPFVGAGLSIEFGFPSWPRFLEEAAVGRKAEKVLAEIRGNRLIEAATLIYSESPDRFQRLVEKWFGGPMPADQARTGAVSLLPLLAKGPSITTNFDRVLESAFNAAGLAFERTITDRESDNTIRAMHRNEHVLIKMHGDWSDRTARVFTGLEYDRHYGPGGIPTLARIMFTNRPLLFLGCSLEKDRTLDVLEDLHRQIRGMTHYAVVAASYSVRTLYERRRELDNYGIAPLWFVPNDFDRIKGILEELVHAASTRSHWRNPEPEAAWSQRAATRGGATAAQPRVATRSASRGHAALDFFVRRVAKHIVRGQVAFFLGAGAHLNPPLGARKFYESLARDHEFNDEDSQRAEVAQFLIDREGKAQAWATAKLELLELLAKQTLPSPVFGFLADLPGMLRQAGRSGVADQWFLTTNYDIVLEETLADQGERFHLLQYQVDGVDEGRFAHRDLSGSIWMIERPENVRSLGAPANVVVKIDGGISFDPHVPETVAISPLDFSISAGRLTRALPEAVRQVLRTRSLLVLGSSLRDPHVQQLVRSYAGSSRVIKTWAVMNPVTKNAAQYWSAAGVELVERDLAQFVPDLRRELQQLL